MAVGRQGRKWVADYRDRFGRRRRKTFSTREEAVGFENDARRTARRRRIQELRFDPEVSLKEYAAHWLGTQRGTLKASTIRVYEGCLRVHLLPAFGSRRIRTLRRGELRAFLAEKLKSGLSKDSVRLLLATIRVILNAAIDDEIIEANSADRLGRAVHLGGARAARQEQIKAFDRDQLSALLAAAQREEPQLYPLLLTLARTGMRIGEALGLQWDDIDWSRREIRISRAISTARQATTPKSGHGRTVDMSSQLASVLKQSRAFLQAEALRQGGSLTVWAFPSKAGTPLDHSNVGHRFKRLLKRAGLPGHFHPHCLRHTYASLLLQAGRSPVYVQRQLGHASYQLTVDTYGRWLPMGNKEAVDALDDGAGEGAQSEWTLSPRSGHLPIAAGSPEVVEKNGAPRTIRTCDLQIRSLLLYPAELGAHRKEHG